MRLRFKICIIIFFFSFTSISQTKLGLRANSAPWQIPFYDSLNAEAGRQIIADNLLNPTFNSQFNNSLNDLKQLGVETIVCLRFPSDPMDSQGFDRSPYMDPIDLDTSLAKIEDFILTIADNVDYIQIQNEPSFGPGMYMDTLQNGDLIHLSYYGYKWMDTLASRLNEIIQTNNLNIGVIGPAFHNVESSLDQSAQTNLLTYVRAPGDTVFAGQLTTDHFPKPFEEMMMDVSIDHCSLIDVHLNVNGIPEIDERIKNLDSLQILRNGIVSKPYTTLEWSQANEKKDLINANPAYHQFLDDAYNGLVSVNDWYSFIQDTLDYDTTFIQNAFCKFQEYGLEHACYAGLIMYGNPADDFAQIFSTVALLTNEVTSPIYPNEPFYSLFKNLDTNCDLGIVKNDSENEINIWPNPAQNVINIVTKPDLKDVRVHVYSSSGKLIIEDIVFILTGNQSFQIDVSNLAQGMYILRFEHSVGTQSSRFFKD